MRIGPPSRGALLGCSLNIYSDPLVWVRLGYIVPEMMGRGSKGPAKAPGALYA